MRVEHLRIASHILATHYSWFLSDATISVISPCSCSCYKDDYTLFHPSPPFHYPIPLHTQIPPLTAHSQLTLCVISSDLPLPLVLTTLQLHRHPWPCGIRNHKTFSLSHSPFGSNRRTELISASSSLFSLLHQSHQLPLTVSSVRVRTVRIVPELKTLLPLAYQWRLPTTLSLSQALLPQHCRLTAGRPSSKRSL